MWGQSTQDPACKPNARMSAPLPGPPRLPGSPGRSWVWLSLVGRLGRHAGTPGHLLPQFHVGAAGPSPKHEGRTHPPHRPRTQHTAFPRAGREADSGRHALCMRNVGASSLFQRAPLREGSPVVSQSHPAYRWWDSSVHPSGQSAMPPSLGLHVPWDSKLEGRNHVAQPLPPTMLRAGQVYSRS